MDQRSKCKKENLRTNKLAKIEKLAKNNPYTVLTAKNMERNQQIF